MEFTLENEIASVLNKYPPDTIFLAAVSGGADSMAMLAALSSLISQYRFSVLHVEHGIRPSEESNGDAEFVRAFCEKNGIECSVEHIPQGKIASYAQRKKIGIEAAARHFRHKALRAKAAQLKQDSPLGENVRILIAHTKDDALELTLMRVLRGCGPAGLAAMPQSRAQVTGSNEQIADSRGQIKRNVSIVRPLLSLSRIDVIDYLKTKNISWREDATNTDEKFLRNKVRRRLVSLLDENFPSWRTGVDTMSQTQSLAVEFIIQEAKKRISWGIGSRESLSTNAENFFSQSLIIREEAIFLAIDKLLKKASNPRSVKRAVIRKFCANCLDEENMKAVDLGTVKIRHEKNMIIVSRKGEEFFERGVSRLI